MKSKHQITLAKSFNESKKKAKISIRKCYYPNCDDDSINSHLLQKNGILSSIETNGHLYQQVIDQFKTPPIYFKRIGINEVFSFNCFCNKHDTSLFDKIENHDIDFSNYEHLLLLKLRTVLNEKNKKEIVIKQHEILKNEYSQTVDVSNLHDYNEQEKIGLVDLEKIESKIWSDLKSCDESFIFKVREFEFKEVCLSAYFTYETTNELEEYKNKHGNYPDEISDIFINFFPYKKKSILVMSYMKKNEDIVKGYVNSFFSESQRRVERRITNLMLFSM